MHSFCFFFKYKNHSKNLLSYQIQKKEFYRFINNNSIILNYEMIVQVF